MKHNPQTQAMEGQTPNVADQARALIEADRQARLQGATAELNEFLKAWGDKWRTQIVPVWLVRGGQTTHTVEVATID